MMVACLVLGGGPIITLSDIYVLIKMSDEEFEAKYELRRVNFNNLLSFNLLNFNTLAALLIILGVSGLIVKDKIVCPSQFVSQDCIFLDSNARDSRYEGKKISGELSRWIINFPPYLLGAGGVLILREALKKRERE